MLTTRPPDRKVLGSTEIVACILKLKMCVSIMITRLSKTEVDPATGT
jgi:hypothetical protein